MRRWCARHSQYWSTVQYRSAPKQSLPGGYYRRPLRRPFAAAVDRKGITRCLAFVIFLPLLWLGFVVSVKRWHDRNKSGLWIVINLAPVIGGRWSLIECVMDRPG